MTRRKTLSGLTIKDNFMFGAVMCNEELCRQLLELVLDFPIARVEVSKEKCIVYHPAYKGVRLDVYAKDENQTHYNVEMQAVFAKSEETMWECRNCGHLVIGKKAPEVCPVCAHPQSYFEVRKENY